MKVIVAAGSAVVRTIFEQNLKEYPDVEVSASVSNGKKIIQVLEKEHSDAVIWVLDKEDQLELENFNILQNDFHIPVLVPEKMPKVNSFTKDFFDALLKKLNKLIKNSPSQSAPVVTESKNASFKVLCIGASTGGPSAVVEVLSGLGPDFPLPVLYAQHIEVGADKNLADWLTQTCRNIPVTLAEDGEEALPSHVYMAPADKHLVIDYVKGDGHPVLKLSDEEPERFLRPAVNKLFRSASQFYKKECLAVLLTGMGMDGAEGCKVICDNGGWTIAEDESTCAVFGMPAAAIEAGGAKEVLPRPEISKRILELVSK
ncbi:chemotaxis protein CheB [Treponema sp.]|uniref:chemotaxis protein CheB n=1 Tax=Treponema sp. TaxID=166 RepID=UPI00388DD7A9